MEPKTKVSAEDGRQDLNISRDFELPVQLLFKAFTDAGLIEQWMGNTVLKLDAKKHGGFEFQKKDPQGNIVFAANGVIHDLVADKKIMRTFEMENTNFGVQLEHYSFEKIDGNNSRLNVHIVFESGAHRDQMLQLPFVQGINYAHKRLEEIVSTL